MSENTPAVETAGQGLPPPATWNASGVPPAMTQEEMEKALENSRRLRDFRTQVLKIWLQSDHKRSGVTTLHQSDFPYFEEWALHELWQISGGGTIECVRQPTRVEQGNGHFYYECTWRARHRYLGTVDGHGIASSGDTFLGTNEEGRAKAESQGKDFNEKRPLGAVNPHNIAQAASTRAKRSALEEILGTQGYSWSELNRLSPRIPSGFDAKGEPIFTPAADAPAPPRTPPPPKAAAPAAPAQPKAPPAPPAKAVDPTPDQLAQPMPPDSWKKEPGPMPEGDASNRIPPLEYLAKQILGAKLVTPEELQAHAKLRRGFKGDSIRDANPELHTELAGDCARCLRWVRAALPAWNKRVAETISF